MVLAIFLFSAVALFRGSFGLGSVAFTAGQDTHLVLVNQSTVPFTKIITNENAQLSSGIFTCTSSGIYKFQVYSLTKSNETLFLELFQNSKLVASLWARTKTDYADAGNAVILSLMDGDTVQAKSRDEYYVATYGRSDQIYTTFTGVRLGGNPGGGFEENPATAFSVARTTHQNVIGGAPVVYNTIQLDTDNAYDVSSGIFTAPFSGIYEFHFFSLARNDQELWQELFHNGMYVCSLYGKTVQDYADAGNSVILHLKAGDQIQIRAHASRPNNIYGAADQIYSTFSGYLMVPEARINTPDDGQTVYFSAGLSQQKTFLDGDKIVFDRVFTEHGTFNHYNHINGEFTAPYSGLYEFNFHALGQKSQPVNLQLYVNYRYVDSLYSHMPNGYATAGNAAVVDMDAGDIAYIRAHGTNALYGTNGQVYCTFSGSLIQVRDGSVHVVGK